MSEKLPEISRLIQLLAAIENVPTNHHKRNAARVIADLYGAISGIDSQFDSQFSLLQSVRNLPALVVEQFPERGRQAAALGNVERLKELLSPSSTGLMFENFLTTTAATRSFLASTMMLFDDITFDGEKLKGEIPDIVGEIGSLRKKIHQSDGLSHASKSVIDAQLSLMEGSLVRFENIGVGPFRDSVFCSIGRIYIELKSNSANDKVAVRDAMDDVLRVYGLMEAGGTLLSLGAPVAVKLLTGG